MGDLDGQVVLVTGATRGIGKASAIAFAVAGARLVLVGRSTDSAPNRGGLPGTLQSVAAEATALGAEVLTVAADLADPADVQRVVDETLERYGRCDVLVNNAAVSFVGPFLEVPARRWRPVIDVNLIAPVLLTHSLLPGMLERGKGSIINVTSGAADTGTHAEVPQLPYAASKAGMNAMSFGLADQLAGTGVAVNLLAPEVLTEAVTFSVHDPEILESLSRTDGRPEGLRRGGGLGGPAAGLVHRSVPHQPRPHRPRRPLARLTRALSGAWLAESVPDLRNEDLGRVVRVDVFVDPDDLAVADGHDEAVAVVVQPSRRLGVALHLERNPVP